MPFWKLSACVSLVVCGAFLRFADAVRDSVSYSSNITAEGLPGKKSSKAARAELRRQRDAELEAMRVLMRSYETLQSLPDFLKDDEEHTAEFAFLGLHAKELASKDPQFKSEWADMWRLAPPRDPVEKLECGKTHMRYATKRLGRNYAQRRKALEQKAKSSCRFGKSATVFIWHKNDGNVGHVGMLLGPPENEFENYRLTQYDSDDIGKHNEYTPGIGPHKAFSGCKNHPASWRSGNCFTYVSWWPAAPGVRRNPLTPVEASMHDFDSDQASEDPMEPEVIPIDTLSDAEVHSAIRFFQKMRGNSEKTYNLITENCAIGVGKVLAFGACNGDPCMHSGLSVTKDATGDLALILGEEGCEKAECRICHDGDPSCGAAALFGDW